MSKDHEKVMTDLQRLMATQDFKSEADLKKFLSGLQKNPIPSFPKEVLTDKEKAQDLVFEAYELPPAIASKNIELALSLDPNCIEAYEFLGVNAVMSEIAVAFFSRGVLIGRRQFGGQFLKESKGHFWLIHETRPFMRCLFQYAECLYSMGNTAESFEVYEELLKLNPGDNQGVRDTYMLYLVEHNDFEKFLKYEKKYKETFRLFPLMNRALYLFKTQGITEESNKVLALAKEKNPHIQKLLLRKETVNEVPEGYLIGSAEEAQYYTFFAKHIWQATKGAMAWLAKG